MDKIIIVLVINTVLFNTIIIVWKNWKYLKCLMNYYAYK